MNHTPDATTADNDDFDPREAAALLDQATQQARRGIEPFPAWFTIIRAVIALVIYGTVWLTVRGQHPYNHPTSAIVPVAVVLVVVNLVATITLAKRATIGISGRSRLRWAEIAAMTVVWIGVYVILGVLAGVGVSHSIVYGIYPATVPIMAAGLAWAGIMAVRGNWRAVGTALAVVAVGAVGVLAGPVGSWAVVGVGLFLALLGTAAVVTWRQHRSVVRP